MPNRLSPAAVVACLALVAATFGGAYALAQDEPAAETREPAPPATIELAKERLPEPGKAKPLPDLAAPAPLPKPNKEEEPDPDAADGEAIEPVEPAARPDPVTPAPAPPPAPAPTPDPAPPETFDDSG